MCVCGFAKTKLLFLQIASLIERRLLFNQRKHILNMRRKRFLFVRRLNISRGGEVVSRAKLVPHNLGGYEQMAFLQL
ncbi:MAG: hypothetical protein COW88_02960 [Candidatus Lloydbacteria bacterium CG22_combo_CG10-13_8_21_14_all_47_15]|uniref:Uncharacterized protein n=1 Tax=Candidatus Lloydbacteria bacterium CG22_combo_CG10-13_8_21_14_all_47_15 TaxID=1974635 RepID=A0A2H0CUP6_9BACT|nr:MAG: hypothetical protein COW88_02960 [Candidatus Lloydbacteria bacterium CG22_combo_CG10-13_8_21_14_all_47_15]